MPVVDIHTHAIPRFFFDEVASSGLFGARIEGDEIIHADGDRFEIEPTFHDPAKRVAEMDRFGIDVSVLSVSPTLFFYSEPADEAVDFARRTNDALAGWVSDSPDRFAAFATLPLQAPEEAAEELRRAVTEAGLVGAAIATDLPGDRPLDGPELVPVFEVADELGAVVLLHPRDPHGPMLDGYHMPNTVGNPVATTVAAARLISSGTLERFPSLRVVLVHAGGFLPYQFGRFDRAFSVRTESSLNISKKPSSYLDRFWIDSVTHSTPALEYLAQLIGAERLVLGSDYPFDMQDPDPVGRVRDAGLDPDVLGATALDLIGHSGVATASTA